MKNILTIALLSTLFLACQTESQYNNEDLMGTWHAFTINTNGDIQEVNKGKVNFRFNEAVSTSSTSTISIFSSIFTRD